MNREIFPGGVYPLQGDVSSQAGSNTVTVTGIQNISVATTPPTDGQVLQFNQTNVQYAPASVPFNKSIQVNGVAVSDDCSIFVNLPGLHGQVLINGV